MPRDECSKSSSFTCHSNLCCMLAGERKRQHVRTTPDITGCLTVSIRANANWEKTGSVGLQIGASGVKLQEYANYLNWSGDGFLDNQFDQAADRVTCAARHEPQPGPLWNGLQCSKKAKCNFFRGSNSVSSCQVVAGPQTWPVNNSVSVDLIRQGGSI